MLHVEYRKVEALIPFARNPRTHFLGAPDCRPKFESLKLPTGRYTILDRGKTLDFGDFTITGVYADHGELAPDALGVLLRADGITVWQVGDTAYRPDKWQDVFRQGIDVILPPINGAFGNLNAVEAARLAGDARAKVAIPCHFWMFAEHNGNPAQFLDACKELAADVKPVLLSPGERFMVIKS